MLFEQLDSQSLKALLFAIEQGFSQQRDIIGTEFILLGLIAQKSFVRNETTFESIISSQNQEVTLERVQAVIFDVLEAIDNNQSEFNLISSPSSVETVESGNCSTALFVFTEGMNFSDRVMQVFERAESIADQSGQHFISTLHILLGLVEEGQEIIQGQHSNAVKILEHLGVNMQELQARIVQTLQSQD